MYCVNFYSLFEYPKSDWEAMFDPKETPPESNLFGWRVTKMKADEYILFIGFETTDEVHSQVYWTSNCLKI